ncbi:MAG: hypothetical protein ACREP7_06385 [Lysobacter sp.]
MANKKNEWIFESQERLGEIVREIDIEVPLRSGGRTKDHTERYCVARLLLTMPVRLLGFPMILRHLDRPDFVLVTQNGEIGIEHTEVISPNVAHAAFLREKGFGPDVYPRSPAFAGEPIKTADELIQEIEDDSMGDGWSGDSVEREWVAAMVHCINRKISKTRLNGFSRYERNWLLLYDNWGGAALNFRLAISLLMPLLIGDDVYSVFDKIIIMEDRTMCSLDGTAIFYSVSNPKDRPGDQANC